MASKNSVLDELLYRSIYRNNISKYEAISLLESDETDSLLNVAYYLKNMNKKNIITYSRKVFINITNLCRDFCSYCTYRKDPYNSNAVMMKPDEILNLAATGKKFRCTEALIVSGERPEERYMESREWLRALNYKSIAEYVGDISEKIVTKTGLFPHSNLGNIEKKEMEILREYNVSLGIMLESSSQRLLEKGMPHENAPSKDPKKRIETIENAGRLKIPLTTGLLVGIGENLEEIIDSLFLIKSINSKYNHIQEIILQNFRPKTNTRMHNFPPPTYNYFVKVVAIARLIMPDMNIQIPPNLSSHNYSSFLKAGINDWGGISPLTIDHVNPEFAWPHIKELKKKTETEGQKLKARLPIYPEFITKEFISQKLRNYIYSTTDKDGLIKDEYWIES